MNADRISRPQLILHGGVVDNVEADYAGPKAVLEAICRAGYQRLLTGDAALDVVEDVVDQLERSGAFVAGKGSSPNRAGDYELDGSIMDGRTARAGAVAAVRNASGAARLARLVMEETDHVLLAGDGVRTAFGERRGLFVDDPAAYFAPVTAAKAGASKRDHGTVGAAALDLSGRFAAATATGGLRNKRPGRVGDPAIIGAGTWADSAVAVTCTGEGEFFIRTAAAANVAYRMRFGGADTDAATAAVIAEIDRLGGHGGIIAAHRGGVSIAFNTAGIQVAWVDERGECHAGVRNA